MRKIKYRIDKPFEHKVDMSIIDITDEKEKKRGGFAIDFTESDVLPLIRQGKDLDETVKYYEERIYATIRRYILSEFEVVEGHNELMEIIREHIKKYFI